jgi:hypothetical protein
MAVVTRNMLPVVEPRRRPTHRELGRGATHVGRSSPTPARALTLVALATLRRAGRVAGRPARWAAPTFAREVDLVRLHLAPIRSRSGLAASFGREAFHADVASDRANTGPVTAAYAIRWLELGDGAVRPAWEAWLADAAPRPGAAGADRRA